MVEDVRAQQLGNGENPLGVPVLGNLLPHLIAARFTAHDGQNDRV